MVADWTEDMELSEEALIPAFYRGREVLVTGGTGFLGKVLLERLLWTCRDVCRVHVLVRHKRDQTPAQRLLLLKQDQIFGNIRAHCPEQLEKLCVVSGDVSLPALGLDDGALQLVKHVSVVFHNAANVKFFQSLPSVLQQNVYSVGELVDICDQLPNMEAFVYVSTAYTNAEHSHVEEKVLPPPIPLDKVRNIVESLPLEIIDEITPKLISPKLNSYLFSKSLAENLLVDRQDRHYAIAICRPSIVVSSVRHPYPGWVEGLTGSSGYMAGCAAGVLHVAYANNNMHADIVPADISTDLTLAIAWDIVNNRAEGVRVYNVSSEENPVTWGEFLRWGVHNSRNYAFENVLYYPFVIATHNKYTFKILQWLLHTELLYFASKAAAICRRTQKINFSSVRARLRLMIGVLSHFSTNEWRFTTDNVRRMRDKLTPADRRIYNLDINAVNWETHFGDFVQGIRKYVMKQSDDTLPRARTNMNRLRCIHYGVLFTLFAVFCRLLWKILPFVRKLPHSGNIVLAAIRHRLQVMTSQGTPKLLYLFNTKLYL